MKQGKMPSEQDLKQGFTRGETSFGPDHFTEKQAEREAEKVSPSYETVRDRAFPKPTQD